MSGVINGRYVGADRGDIEEAQLRRLQEETDRSVNTDEVSLFRSYYRPTSDVLAAVQADMRALLDSTRLEYAEGRSLDLVADQNGVSRKPALPASGIQQFYVNTALGHDVEIPEGLVVVASQATAGEREFETTEYAKLPAGNLSVTVGVQARTPGVNGNVAADTITSFKQSKPDTNLHTTNPNGLTGGRARENDDELKRRVRLGGAEQATGTLDGLIASLRRLEKVRGVHVFVNDTDTDNYYGNNIPAGHMEIIVSNTYQVGNEQPIIDTIGRNVAAGEPLTSGVNGASITGQYTMDNNQQFQFEFSEPAEQALYVDAAYSYYPDEYEGDAEVKDAMVEYVGGILTDGSFSRSDGLGMGEDVLAGELDAAIRSVEGVYDVTSLAFDTTSSPTNTSNLAIASTEIAVLDARDASGFITLTPTER